MNVKFTLTEAEIKRAIIEHVSNNTAHLEGAPDEPTVHLTRDPTTGQWSATIEIDEGL